MLRWIAFLSLSVLLGLGILVSAIMLEGRGAPSGITFISLLLLGAPLIYFLARAFGLIPPGKIVGGGR